MSKLYHFIYLLNDAGLDHSEFLDLNPLVSDEYNIDQDIMLYLDAQNFNVSSSVVNKVIEYAGRQVGDKLG